VSSRGVADLLLLEFFIVRVFDFTYRGHYRDMRDFERQSLDAELNEFQGCGSDINLSLRHIHVPHFSPQVHVSHVHYLRLSFLQLDSPASFSL
jgi:hypothetical protein